MARTSYRVLPMRISREGVIAAEFSLVLPLLMLIVLICIDFGRVAYTFIAVTNAARAGAAHAIMNPYYASQQEAAWKTAIQDKAREEMAQQTGYDPNRLTVTTTHINEGNGFHRIRVEATFDAFETLVAWPGIPDTLILRRMVEMRAIR